MELSNLPQGSKKWRAYILALTLALISLLAGVCFAVPPTPPAVIEVDEKIREGKLSDAKGEIELPIVIRLNQEIDVIEIETFVSQPGKDRLTQKPERRLKKEIKVRGKKISKFSVPMSIKGPGHYELDIRIRGEIKKGNAFSDRKIRHFIVEKDGRFKILTGKELIRQERERRENMFEEHLKKHPEAPKIRLLFPESIKLPGDIVKSVRPFDIPESKKLLVRPSGPSEKLRKYSIDNSDKSWAPEDPITVRGRVVFEDYDGVWRPLVNVSVNLWDEDTGFDEHLGVTSTDWNGDWSFSVNNDDGFWQDGRDIYYTFKLENTRIRVQDCDGIDSTYKWESAVHDDLSDGSVVDFGAETGSTHKKTMQVWSHLNLAWNHAATTGGRDPGFVDTCYPEDGGTHWDRTWEEIDIGEEYNDGPDVVTHEYGHAVMWYAYGDDNPSPGGSHTFDGCPQDKGLSWSEGWATGFMLSARPDGEYNWHEGSGGRNIENFDSACKDGNRNEGRVAAAINDMRDSPNDCNGGDTDLGRDGYCDNNSGNRAPLSKMLNDTLWGGWHDEFVDFWYSLSGELTSAQRTPAHEIMYYNWMPVTEPGSCVASKVAAMDAKKPESMLEGLRNFRNHALKGFEGGQQLINMYYRNSPEVALMLLGDEKLRKQAFQIMAHFSELGHTITSNKASKKMVDMDTPVIPEDMQKMIDVTLLKLEKEGSKELGNDVHQLRRFLEKTKGLGIREFSEKVKQTKIKRTKVKRRQLRQSEHNPASRKAAGSPELKKIAPGVKPPRVR